MVLGRDDAASNDEEVAAAKLLELMDQLGDERLVASRLRAHTDNVHVRVDGLASNLGRGLTSVCVCVCVCGVCMCVCDVSMFRKLAQKRGTAIVF